MLNPKDYTDSAAALPHGFSGIPGILRGFRLVRTQRFTRKSVTGRDWYKGVVEKGDRLPAGTEDRWNFRP